MSKTYQFTLNSNDQPINLVISKIEKFEFDEFSECTTIQLCSGEKIGVVESVDEVRGVVESADTT